VGGGHDLSERARRHIRDLVIASGGASEREAALLLLAIRRLSQIEREKGPEAAEDAALAFRRAWLAEEDPRA
jgi:hypothetical protein